MAGGQDRICSFLSRLCIAAYLMLCPALALANPQDGVVRAGSASISAAAGTLSITQSTPKAVINWRSFNIAPGETTQFHQPGSSSLTLNRVGSGGASQIYGSLTANGNIVIVNPNGVLFGRGSKVDVNGLIATTADIRNRDFMKGRLNFSRPGNPGASVVNEGAITAKQAGLVGLVAPNVANSGVITAELGHVQLSSGDTVTVDLYGDKLMEVAVSGQVNSQLVSNSGVISAAGGRIALTAAAGNDIVNSLITVRGELKAPAIGRKNGKIFIYAEGANAVRGNVAANKGVKTGGSTVLVSGRLDVSGRNAGERGGTIQVLGDNAGLLSGARLDASGQAGGGTVRVGGDYRGAGKTPTAKNAVMQPDTIINADALRSGDGGKVTLWADEHTDFYGFITARGGAEGGNGGFVETSGWQTLNAAGLVDASAPLGKAGLWLLDPNNITIQAAGPDANIAGNPNWTTTNNTAILTTGSIQAALNAGTSVSVTTGAAGANSQLGNITVASPIAKSAGGDATLTLTAHNNITVNAGATISSSTGKLGVALNADSDASGSGMISVAANITSNGGNIVMGGGANPLTTAAFGNATSVIGVFINNATVNAGGGNISIRGQGYNTTTNNNYGIRVTGASGALSTTGAGTVSVTGAGGGNTNSGFNHGVYVDTGGVISAVDGALSVTGAGGNSSGSGARNYGVSVAGASAAISATGSGTITVTGAGWGNTNSGFDYGVYVGSGGVISAVNGALSVTGIGGGAGTGVNNHGVLVNLANSTIKTTGTGAVSITGTGGNASGSGGNNVGVVVTTPNGIQAAGAGNIAVTGMGSASTGASNSGVSVTGSITGAGGNIAVTGTGGNSSGNSNRGIQVMGASGAISATGAGTVSVTGAGGGNTNSGLDYGVYVDTGGVISAVDGALSVTGTGGGAGTGANNYGVYVLSASSTIKTAGAGALNVTGIGGNGGGGTNYGVDIAIANGLRTSGGGAVTVRTDSILLNAANNINSIDNLTILPYTAGTTVGLGAGAGTLSLTTAYLGDIAWGAGKLLTIGGTVAGDMDINTAYTFANPAAFVTGAAGDITVNGALASSVGSGTSLILASGKNFINNVGSSAINPGSGRWLVYSTNPANDTINSLSNDFRRFSCTYGGSCPSFPATGNGFLYTTTPSLTATPNNLAGITYGDAAPSVTGYAYTLAGYLGSDAAADTITGALDGSTAYTQGSNAGTYNLDYASGTLAGLLGYGFSYASNATALAVAKRTLTATLQDKTITYGTATPALNKDSAADVVWSNFYGADTSANIGSVAFTYGGATPGSGNNAGSYTLGASSTTATNYTLGTVTTGTLTINPYTLAVVADAKAKVYGAADPSLTYTYGALQNGDTAAVFNGGLTRAVGETVAGGPYAIGQGTLSAGSNYTISYTGGNLTITPYSLSVLADAKSKVYGSADPALTYTNGALQNGDTASVFSGGLTRAVGETVAGGPYAIGQGTLSAGTNYTISYSGNNLTITPYTLPNTFLHVSQHPVIMSALTETGEAAGSANSDETDSKRRKKPEKATHGKLLAIDPVLKRQLSLDSKIEF